MACKMVIGLGNPGPAFKNTRHNLGNMVVDYAVKQLAITWVETPFYHYSKYNQIIFVKSMSMMNVSGFAVKIALEKFKIAPAQTLILHDDLERNLGKVSFKTAGSANGHNGVKSIISKLNTKDFERMRLGIGRPIDNSIPKYVLERFSLEETTRLNSGLFDLYYDLLMKHVQKQ